MCRLNSRPSVDMFANECGVADIATSTSIYYERACGFRKHEKDGCVHITVFMNASEDEGAVRDWNLLISIWDLDDFEEKFLKRVQGVRISDF